MITKMMRSNILKIHNDLKNGLITFEDLIKQKYLLLDRYKSCNSVITNLKKDVIENIAKFDKRNLYDDNLLYGIPYSLKDNICTKNILTTAGSKFLKNFIPTYSATTYEILQKEGAILLSKDAMDEYGLGGKGEFCFTGCVKNPLNLSKSTAGSSSGSVCNVAMGFSTFAIATDTGDSIVKPSSYVGVIGYKPTYGLISRNGIIPFSPSQDTVGIISKYVMDACIVATYLQKYDCIDLTSTKNPKSVNFKKLKIIKKIKFIVYKNLLEKLEDKIRNKFFNLCEKLKKIGHEIIEQNFDQKFFSLLPTIYQVLTFTNACSCHNNLIGNLFGENANAQPTTYEKFATKNRTLFFDKEFKARLTLGSYLMNNDNFENIYLQACKFRSWIQHFHLSTLSLGDVILMPCCCCEALDLYQEKSNHDLSYDNHLMIDNFVGTPSISLPWTKNNDMPINIHLRAKIYDDMNLLNIAYTLENIIGRDNE